MPTKKELRPPKDPSSLVSEKFQAEALRLSADFIASDAFNHALTKGEQREQPIIDFFKANLPDRFEVVSGEVVDPYGKSSPQLDLMFYDRMENIPLVSGRATILPAEALIASIEVKSTLTKSELEKSNAAAEKLRQLKPFKRALYEKPRGKSNRSDRCRYFHVLFAYGTNLSESDWLEKEFNRISMIPSFGRNIDRVYVARRGLLHPARSRGICEESTSGIGLMNLYVHLFNYLLRESRNRQGAPYEQYYGRLSSGWESLE